MDHSYEEIRSVALDILAGRETGELEYSNFESFGSTIAEVLHRRERPSDIIMGQSFLSKHDKEIYLEVFWNLFREGIITLGLNANNPNFPYFRLSSIGEKILESGDPYFFHNVSSYEKIIIDNISDIDEVTLVYLKEAMQAFFSGCILSASVMLGVATEHSFMKLLDKVEANPNYNKKYSNVFKQRNILKKLNKFKNILDQNLDNFPPNIKEDLDTNFSSIISMIRNFRNESGHPSGKIISREQCYVLLQLFVPCCKKIYELIRFF